MPPRAHRPDVLRGRVFRGTWVVEQGLLTRGQLRSSAWRRLREDVYADADEPDTHRLRARGACLVMPPGAALGGRTAAYLHGLEDVAGPLDPVEVVLPPGTRWHPQPGVVVRSAPLAGAVVGYGPWLRWTSGVRTAVDLARRETPVEAVVLLDRLVQAGAVDLAELRAAAAALPRCRGSARARTAVAAADGLAESPQETRVRLLLRASELPAPVAQYVVRGRGPVRREGGLRLAGAPAGARVRRRVARRAGAVRPRPRAAQPPDGGGLASGLRYRGRHAPAGAPHGEAPGSSRVLTSRWVRQQALFWVGNAAVVHPWPALQTTGGASGEATG